MYVKMKNSRNHVVLSNVRRIVMDCKTARLVWNHEHGFLGGVKEYLPGVFERILESVQGFVNNKPDSFNTAVQQLAGKGNYRVTHSLGEDPIARGVHDVLGDNVARTMLEKHFSSVFKRNICLANICCNGCSVTDGTVDEAHMFAIQMASVNTDPETLP